MDKVNPGKTLPCPKRQKANDNPYRIFAVLAENGAIKYYVRFVDGVNGRHCIEVSKELFALFNQFELEDLSYFNRRDKYQERSKKTEEQMSLAYARYKESVEDEVLRRMDQEHLYHAILKLSMTQRRRVILHYFDELTYQQIAEQEGCLNPAVWKSVRHALKNLKKYLK